MTKKIAAAFVLSCLVLHLPGVLYPFPAKKNSLILATATTGGTYYPVGVAVATLATQKLARSNNIYLTAITSAGSGENIQLLKNREADLAIIQGLYGAMAWPGKGKYKGDAQKYLRSLCVLWDNVEHFTIKNKYRKTGDISDMANLRRRNFSIGKRGSGTEMSGRTILKAMGFDPDKDFKLQYLGYTPSANALQNNRIAGMNIPAGPPASAVTQAFAAIGVNKLAVLFFNDSQLAAVNSYYPVWRRAVIKAGTYPGQKNDISTISQPNLLIVHQDIDEEVVYQLVKTIFENLEYLRNIHQATKTMTLEQAVTGLSVPLHPGAVRFYREKGISLPSGLARD